MMPLLFSQRGFAMKKCVILASMPAADSLRHWCDGADLFIAADAGWRQAQAWGLSPDLYLGDYDSAPAPEGVPAARLDRLPAEKDDTDTHYAARRALAAGCGEVVILGGLGGRLDHTLANLNTLLFLSQNGVQAVLADEATEVRALLPGEHTLAARPGWYCSLFPAQGQVEGLCIENLKYPLAHASLRADWPLGVSNEFLAGPAHIRFEKGALYCVLCRKER